jgi:hypothetical protein
LLIVLSLNCMMQPSLNICDSKQVSQQAAAERFFTADRLAPEWFTPSTLESNNLSELQKQRDNFKAKAERKYGRYQRIEKIATSQYRVVFENANPDLITCTFVFDWLYRIHEIKMQIDKELLQEIQSEILH